MDLHRRTFLYLIELYKTHSKCVIWSLKVEIPNFKDVTLMKTFFKNSQFAKMCTRHIHEIPINKNVSQTALIFAKDSENPIEELLQITSANSFTSMVLILNDRQFDNIYNTNRSILDER